MKALIISCVFVVWLSYNSVGGQISDYEEFVNSKIRIDVVTEKGKTWQPNLDYYCKYRAYDDYNSTPCFCMSMGLKFKYSYKAGRELKKIETKIPEAVWVHGHCFSNSIYVSISWPKYNPSELLYLDPPKENFVLIIFKRNQTHLWMDELSISMTHIIGNSKRPKSIVTVSDTLLNLNFTAPVYDSIYVCDKPVELIGWTGAMEITIENLRFLLYNGLRTRKEVQCVDTLE